MTPITKKEVEEAVKSPRGAWLTQEASAFITVEIGPASPEYWIRLGYEIARLRVEKGEEL